MVRSRHAFSMIELLVVISIIALLAGMLIVAGMAFMGRGKAARTQSVIGILQQALGVAQLEGGALAATTPHPLAASLEPRSRFLRRADGAVLSSSGEALGGLQRLAALAAVDSGRLLLDDDLHLDREHPGLLGLARRDLAILGAPQAAVVRLRRLPDPGEGVVIAVPDGQGRIISGSAAPTDHAAVLHQMLGSFAAELAQLGALREPPAEYSVAIVNNRLLARAESHANWEPGRILVAGAWRDYSLPGAHVVDAWGRELLFGAAGSGNRLHIVSAGADGVFGWHPGPDNNVDATDATIVNALYGSSWPGAGDLGDDRPGHRDNLGTAWAASRP